GKIVSQEEKAVSEIKKIEEKIAICKENMVNTKPQKVLLVSNIGKILTVYTPRTLPGDIVTQLGAIVLGQEQENVGENEFVSYEDVVMLDPDIVFLQSAPDRDSIVLSTFYNNPVLKNLRCAKNKQVFCIPFYTIRSPGIRVSDAIDIFAAGLQKSDGDNYEK
ncbi:ABC transporter substrate-binding protein, partial [Sporomusa sp.]|uniref:ABC transporter substrate-binding protein n=1 Tax=Sporomusa sp. TaxID=2078658 RepID=UPI002B79829C